MPVIKSFDPRQVTMIINGVKIDPTGYADGYTTGRDDQGRWFTEKPASDLQIGEVIYAVFYSGKWQDSGPFEVTSLTRDHIRGFHLVGKQRTGLEMRLLNADDMMLCRILRETPVQKQVVASKWNGKCATCGCGTYTGFTSVEHEGGSCVL